MFRTVMAPARLDITMSASLGNIDKASDKTKEFLAGIPGQVCRFELLLLMREALLNAVKHGSNLDESRNVDCSLEISDGQWMLTVRDQGAGFDWNSVMGREPDELSDCGRGIAIMRMYADEVRYEDDGRKLTLTKSTCRG